VTSHFDLLVVGSGVAGLSAALELNPSMRVCVVTKANVTTSTTQWAQGGVAAVVSGEDSFADHIADTLAAGVGLCNADAVNVLVTEGPQRVAELAARGAQFDLDSKGKFELAREGGHRWPRVIHAGGSATGAEIERALVMAMQHRVEEVFDFSMASELLVENGRCVGVIVIGKDQSRREITANNVLLATGGACQIYSVTTNPTLATGDGMAAALRAGAVVADCEFVQFHPTALYSQREPRPLMTEALRGHGAVLRTINGDRFVDEMLPRDVVSRAITAQMQNDQSAHCWLDATTLNDFEHRFPNLFSILQNEGISPDKDWIPVAPAAHYFCGGIATDLNGATSLPGLWAAGEVACTGVHGANRLASNSLLEGMVFGSRVAHAINANLSATETGALADVHKTSRKLSLSDFWSNHATSSVSKIDPSRLSDVRRAIQDTMTQNAAVIRSAESLQTALDQLNKLATDQDSLEANDSLAGYEVENLLLCAAAVLVSAQSRTESRGAHWRADWPETNPQMAERTALLP